MLFLGLGETAVDPAESLIFLQVRGDPVQVRGVDLFYEVGSITVGVSGHLRPWSRGCRKAIVAPDVSMAIPADGQARRSRRVGYGVASGLAMHLSNHAQ